MVLTWEKLLCSTRRKELRGTKSTGETSANRLEVERDYDRVLFCSPIRRLADKTQVFPMEKNDSVRTRLTHSYEVSNLARGIGVQLAFNFPEKVFGEKYKSLEVERNIPSLLAAIGLAHDLGNPPFGHQGEAAIQQWFKEYSKKHPNEMIEADFLKFDGNAQTLRLVTKLQLINDDFGLNLTVATLAALTKYPVLYGNDSKAFGYKKCGIFNSEKAVIEDVWSLTDLQEGVRHPLTYVMEACDDIAYSVIDAEDTIKKGYASFYDLVDFLESKSDGDVKTNEVLTYAKAKNKEYNALKLSSKELNDLSVQMFRVKAIAVMIDAAVNVFVEKIDLIMSGEPSPDKFELIDKSDCKVLCENLKEFDFHYGFKHRDVLKLELEGNNYIKNMMSMLWQAIEMNDDVRQGEPFEKYIYGSISENYRRVYEQSDMTAYYKRLLLCDVISGMTESYLIEKHDEFTALKPSR